MPFTSGRGSKTAQSLAKEQRHIFLNSTLVFAVKNGQISQVPGLIKQVAEVNATAGGGMTGLMHAALSENSELVDALIRHGAM